MPKRKGKGSGESPDSSFLTFGFGRLFEVTSDLRYSRYRWDSIFRGILIIGITVMFVILLNSVFPSAGAVVKEYMGNQFGATFLAGIADAAAYTMESAVGTTIGATIADGVALGFYKTISPYPSPDYKMLSAKERAFVLKKFKDFDPTLPMSMEALNTISGTLISRAIAFNDVRDVFLNAHKLLFQGKIAALMSIPEIRAFILTEVTKEISDEERRQALFDKYNSFSHLNRIKALGVKFPDGSFLYYGASQFCTNIGEFIKYRRRRGKAAFCNLGTLLSSGGLFYAIMFALPGAEPKIEAFLANELSLSDHIALYITASTGVILLGASVGSHIFSGIYKIYARCRYGPVKDFALSEITDRELTIINANMPAIMRHEDGCAMQVRVIFNLREINSVVGQLVMNMISTGVDHESALLDLIHGKVSEAFMHPRTGPILAERLISDVETRIALLRQFGFPGHAVDTARAEIVNKMRTASQLRSRLGCLLEENESLRERCQASFRENVELRASYDQIAFRERSASNELRRLHSLSLAHPALRRSVERHKEERQKVEVEMRPLRRSGVSATRLGALSSERLIVGETSFATILDIEPGASDYTPEMITTNPFYMHMLREQDGDDFERVVDQVSGSEHIRNHHKHDHM